MLRNKSMAKCLCISLAILIQVCASNALEHDQQPILSNGESLPRLRVAVCFFGLTRSLPYTIDNIRSHLLDPLIAAGFDATIYLHTYAATSITNPRSGEANVTVNPYMFKLLRPHHYRIEPMSVVSALRLTLDQYSNHGDAWKEQNHTSLLNLLAQFRSLQQVTEMWLDKVEHFDAFIYSRTDLWFFNQINLTELSIAFKSSEPVVFTPNFQAWGGLNDRFAFGNAAGMRIYGNRLDYALNYSQTYQLHAEKFLFRVLKTNGVVLHHTNILFSRVRAHGGIQDQPVFDEDGNVVDAAGAGIRLVRRPDGTWEFKIIQQPGTASNRTA